MKTGPNDASRVVQAIGKSFSVLYTAPHSPQESCRLRKCCRSPADSCSISGVCQSLPESCGVCRSLPESCGVCRSLPESAGVCRSLQESAGVCRSLFHYILRYYRFYKFLGSGVLLKMDIVSFLKMESYQKWILYVSWKWSLTRNGYYS